MTHVIRVIEPFLAVRDQVSSSRLFCVCNVSRRVISRELNELGMASQIFIVCKSSS
jgi:hypothetical protein